MNLVSKTIRLKSIPQGSPKLEDFEFVDENINIQNIEELKENQVLVEIQYVSVDPYLRGHLANLHNKVISSPGIAKVIASSSKDYQKDDIVTGMFPWKQYSIIDPKIINPLTKPLIASNKNIPTQCWLSTLGLTGLSAYYGLLEIGSCKEKENVFISGAAGAVGMMVGQIAKKINNCYVVGIAGTNEKCQYLIDDLSFDNAINYKKYNNDSSLLKNELRKLFPNGIDIYFDNTGGFITESVWDLLNKNARVVICGQISNYNQMENRPKIDDFLFKLIYKHIRVEGFVVSDFKNYDVFYKDMIKWVDQKSIISRETVMKGFDNIPNAFIGLFKGDNVGKMVIDCTSNNASDNTSDKTSNNDKNQS